MARIRISIVRKVGKNEPFDARDKVERVIVSLSKNFASLNEVRIKHALETSRSFILVSNKQDVAKLVGKEGEIVKILSKELGKPVKILEPLGPRAQKDDLHRMFGNLLRPVNITGINILYVPNSTKKIYKICVSNKDKTLLPLAAEDFGAVAKEIVKQEAHLVFE